MNKTTLLLIGLMSLGLCVKAEISITSTIWNGERQNECDWITNNDGNENEPITYVATPANTQSGIYNPSEHCLLMIREQKTGYEWHGIRFNVSNLNITMAQGNQYSLLVRKDKSENVRLEFVFNDDTHFWSNLSWHNGDNKWQRQIFNLWEAADFDANKDKTIKYIYIQLHTGGSDESLAEIYFDDFMCGFDLNLMPFSYEFLSGYTSLKDYPLYIDHLQIHNNAELGDVHTDSEEQWCERHVNTFHYVKDINTSKVWEMIGISPYLGTASNSGLAAKYIETMSSNGNWQTETTMLPLCMAMFDNTGTVKYTFNDLILTYNDAVTLSDGYQLISNPLLQPYLASALRADNVVIYTPNEDNTKLIKQTVNDVYIAPYTAFVAYKGDDAAEQADEIDMLPPVSTKADINGVFYNSLADAFNAAQTGDEIRLWVDTNEELDTDKQISFNAQGHYIASLNLKETAKITLTGNLGITGDLTLRSTMSQCAQIKTHGKTVSVSGNVYLIRDLFADGHFTFGYFCNIAFPFSVNVANGISDINGNSMSGKFSIRVHDGQKRADNGTDMSAKSPLNPWQEETGTLRAGIGYMMAVTSADYRTIRFKAADKTQLFNTASQIDVFSYASSTRRGAQDEGWNYIANPLGCNATAAPADADMFSLVQTCNNNGGNAQSGISQYTTRTLSSLVFAPFSSFVYQSKGDDKINFTVSDATSNVRSINESINPWFEFHLITEGGQIYDALFVQADENATDNYETGYDLLKIGSNQQDAKLWIEAYGSKLTAYRAKISNGKAGASVKMQIPTNGNYTLELAQKALEGDVYLIIDDKRIALEETDSYTFSAEAGIKELEIEIIYNESLSTCITDTESNNINIYSINKTIYVDGVDDFKVYDCNMRQINNPVCINGVYIIEVHGIFYKTIVF